jgi:acid stress-induced BolA-like protein IbaG/YrbA
MDLIEKIQQILEKKLINPTIELRYDEKGNVFGRVISDSFQNRTDTESQSLIWDTLRKSLEKHDLLKIFMIFNETPQEAGFQENTYREKKSKTKFWYHTTPTKTKYWLFVDVNRFKEDFRTFYLVINAKIKFDKCRIYNYPNQVVKFMELKKDELNDELLNQVFISGEAEIMGNLIQQYERTASIGIVAKRNPYNYIYSSFELTPCYSNQLIFNEQEIQILNKYLSKLHFPISKDLKRGIKMSSIINNRQTH